MDTLRIVSLYLMESHDKVTLNVPLNGPAILGTLLFWKTNIIKKCLIIYIKYIIQCHNTKANTIKTDWLLGLTPTILHLVHKIVCIITQ
jgi:hypothetical protein